MKKLFTLFVAALFAANMFATEGALSGKFSTIKPYYACLETNENGDCISSNWENEWIQIQFSQGNLQYNTGTQIWKFADNQWEILSSTDGLMDMFCWGTGDDPTATEAWHQYLGPSEGFKVNFVDWGDNPISNGENTPKNWFTLSRQQWAALIHDRPNGEKLFGMGTVNGIKGIILLPDDWTTTPSGVPAFKSAAQQDMVWYNRFIDHNQYLAYYEGYYDKTVYPDGPETWPLKSKENDHFSDNTYTEGEWSAMQLAGAVFMPAAFSNPGGSYYKNEVAYWSSTYMGALNPDVCYPLWVNATGYDCETYADAGSWSGRCPVRLVQEVDGTEVPKVYTEYNATNHTLTYYYDTQREARTGTTELYKPSDIRFTGYYDKVEKVVIDPSMKNAPLSSMEKLFYGGYNATTWDIQVLTAVTEIEGLGNLHTAGVTDMNNMFFQCESLTNLDLSTFNTSNVTNMNSMFFACKKLQTIDLTSFGITKVTDMRYMFNNCPALTTIYCNDDWSSTTAQSDGMFSLCSSLVGGNGTPYSSSHVDASYARPDEPDSDKPGYFTKKGEEGIENIATPADKARKVMMDGTLYIATPDGAIYDAQGTKVK